MSKSTTVALLAAGLSAAGLVSAGTMTVTNTDAAALPVAPDNGCTDDAAGTGLGGISRTIAFTEVGTITDIDVTLVMTQTWRSDIQVGLSYTGGGGTVRLVNNNDTSGDNLNAIVDSDAALICSDAANCGTAGNCVTPPGPTCQPIDPLTAFNGLATPGTFTLTVCDRAAADTGDLTSWSVTADLDVSGDLPPVFAYNPAPLGTVPFTGGGAIGSMANGSIDVTIGTPGSGTGAANTTTTTCTAPTAPFAGFGQSVTAEGAGAISGSPLSGTCTLGAAPVTQTLTCSENQGGTPVARTFDLNCPAGTVTPITSTPTSGSLITMPTQNFGGPATTAPISFQNPGAAGVDVTCTAPLATEFTASPLIFTVPAMGSSVVTVTYSSLVSGTFVGTLDCTAGAQTFTFDLSGTTGGPAIAVPALGEGARGLMLLAFLGLGLIGFGAYSRRQ